MPSKEGVRGESEAWCEFARLNRDRFVDYEGWCNCWWCRGYREAFEVWYEAEGRGRKAVEGEE